MVLTASQPVLVIMRMSKVYNSKRWFSDKIKKGIRLTDRYKCLSMYSLLHTKDDVCPFESYLIVLSAKIRYDPSKYIKICFLAVM